MSRYDLFAVLVIFACAAVLLLVLTPVSLILRVARGRDR